MPTRVPNKCYAAPRAQVHVDCDHFALRLDFSPSNVQLQRYCETFDYAMVMKYDKETQVSRPTFDENALKILMEKYPKDTLFPLVSRYRAVEKCKSSYVDGLTLLPSDLGNQYGRSCGEYLHIPSTERLAMRGAPHMLQPRTSDETNPYYKVRAMFPAPPGYQMSSLDFGGIEAVLTLYYAGVKDGLPILGREDARQGLRLTNIDIHGFISSHAIGQPADLSWSDADLEDYFALCRKENRQWKVAGGTYAYDDIREANKTGLYASLYLGGPETMMIAQPSLFPDVKAGERTQKLIFDLFPSIQKWHWDVAQEADEFGYVTTPDGFRQYFEGCIQRTFRKRTKTWHSSLGKTAKQAIAAKPQHTGMLFTGAALGRFWKRYPEWRHALRLTVHDDILTLQKAEETLQVARILKECMEEPMPLLPLPEEWGMGSHLRIKVGAKVSEVGGSWRHMKKLAL